MTSLLDISAKKVWNQYNYGDISAKKVWNQYNYGDREQQSEILQYLKNRGLSRSEQRIITLNPKSGRTLKIISDRFFPNKQNKTAKKRPASTKMQIETSVYQSPYSYYPSNSEYISPRSEQFQHYPSNSEDTSPRSEESQYSFDSFVEDDCRNYNCILDDTPKSDIWNITEIDIDTIELLARYSCGYIQKVEKLFAETISSVKRDIRASNRFINDVNLLFFSESILALFVSDIQLIELKLPEGSAFVGGSNSALNNELAFQEDDTQHDFKPGRNKVYPKSIEGKGVKKEPGLAVYGKLNTVIGNTRLPHYGNDYILSSPIAFEEDIKVDYLLGELVGPLEDIYYYFTDVNSNPSSWTKLRQAFFGIQGEQVKVNSINTLVRDVRERGYDGWVLDACVSGRVSSNLGQRKKTLANIWDPVKGTFSLADLVESNSPSKLTLVEDPAVPQDSGYQILDCIVSNNDTSFGSLYDTVYEKLLNFDLLSGSTNFLKIQLRLAVNRSNNICGVAIIITTGQDKKSYIIPSGFPVQVLAQGMRYIDDKYSGSRYEGQIDSILQGIIDHVDTSLTSVLSNATQRSFIIQKMLYRFKSSGDHGTSDTVKVLNKYGLYYLFLSGDNLAYVYAMSSIGTGDPTPTIATYYKESKKTTGDDEEDEEDDGVAMETNNEHIEGNHFIVAYFPAGDDTKKNYIKLFENVDAIYGLANELNISVQPDEVSLQIDTLVPYLNRKNEELLINIKGQQSLLLSPETITREFDTKVSETITDLYQVLMPLRRLSSVDELMETIRLELNLLKNLSGELNGLANKLYFMHKYSAIVTLSQEMIRADREAFAPIVVLDQPQTSGRPQRSITTKLTTAYNAVKKSLIKNITSLRDVNPGQSISEGQSKDAFINALKTNTVTNNKSEYDRVSEIKQTLSINSKSLFKRLKDRLGFSEPFVSAMKNEILTINNPLIQKLKADIFTNAGSDIFAQSLVNTFDGVLQTKISTTSLDISTPASAAASPLVMPSGPSLDDLSLQIDADTPPNDVKIRTGVTENLIFTKSIIPEKKSMISKVKKALSSVASGLGIKRSSGGTKSVKRHNTKRSRKTRKITKRSRKTRKITKRSRKTRKITKRAKYIKKNVTKHRR